MRMFRTVISFYKPIAVSITVDADTVIEVSYLNGSMSRKIYKSPKAKTLTGRAFALPLVNRLSAIEVDSAQPIAWHTHDETEILFCLKGSLSYEFRRQKPLALHEGQFLVIPENVEHRLAGGIDAPCRRCSIFLDPPEKNPRTAPLSRKEHRDLTADLLAKRMRPRPFPARLQPDLQRIHGLVFSGARPTGRAKVELRIFTLSILLTLAASDVPPPQKPEVRLMKEATDWLGRNYAEQITVDDLIAYMGYGRTRFFTLFKKHTGLTPVEWLTRFRIAKATELLRSGTAVAATARQCGFTDPSFFARVFRKQTGRSPSQAREIR